MYAAAVDCNMQYYRDGRFKPFELDSRTRCSAAAVEKAIRSFANEKGDIDSVSILIGTEHIPICHVDEARVVSRMLAADHDCFTDHFYDNGFDDRESSMPCPPATPLDAYDENHLWKLEFEYQQNEDLGTPCFGSSQAHADVY